MFVPGAETTTTRPLIERLFSMILGGFIIARLHEVVNMKAHKNELSKLTAAERREGFSGRKNRPVR